MPPSDSLKVSSKSGQWLCILGLAFKGLFPWPSLLSPVPGCSPIRTVIITLVQAHRFTHVSGSHHVHSHLNLHLTLSLQVLTIFPSQIKASMKPIPLQLISLRCPQAPSPPPSIQDEAHCSLCSYGPQVKPHQARRSPLISNVSSRDLWSACYRLDFSYTCEELWATCIY